jgi:hypothetical protein
VVFSGKLDGNYAELLPLIFLIQHTSAYTVFFPDAVAIFYGRYPKKKH